MTQKIIHVTDCHICPPGQTVVGFDPTARLQTVIQSINENHADADLCVFTGDLTDRGDIESYRQLGHCLEELRVQYCLLLGNHDRRDAFRAVFPNTSVDANGFVQSVLDVGDICVMLLDTLDEVHPAKGLLCDRRLQWLEEQLLRKSGSRLLVFMHHPPFSIGVPFFEDMLMANGHAFMEIVRARQNIEHLAFGHVHMTISGRWEKISYSSNRGTCHKIAPDFKAMAGNFLNAEPAYSVFLVNASGLAIHNFDPAGPNDLVAWEEPTDDGVGELHMSEGRVSRWV